MGETVAILGAAGFAGAIAARLIDRHPWFELGPLTARGEDVGRRLDELYPHHRVAAVLEELDMYSLANTAGAAIVGYPHGAAAPVVAELRERGVRVVDLSADFRLHDQATYELWYGEHGAPHLLGAAVYGLPELNRDRIAGAELVACPGCYPTAALIGLAPLASAGLIGDVVIDAKSGVSGAGRGLTRATHYVSVAENMTPYAVHGHRHTPEIEQALGALGAPGPITFVPHLVPLDQGELISAYVTPPPGASVPPDLYSLYSEQYAGELFVELMEVPPGARDVRETNICAVHARRDERTGRILVFAAIDNLWKGTASQAVQCLNLMYGRPEAEGLSQ